ncbi:hypothetical protein ACOSQ2_005091 [Xanthoceras sorbifolium]
MAPKVKKVEDGTELWPDLPQQLIKMISWQPTLMHNIGDGGVTKSWRSSSRQCNPASKPPKWLELHDDRKDHDTKFKFNITFHLGEHIWYPRRPWPKPWKYYKGFANGSLVAKGTSSRGIVAEGASSPEENYYGISYPNGYESFYSLPPWDPKVPFRHPVVSSCLAKSVMMVLTGVSHPAFAFCRLEGRGRFEKYEWIKHDCTIPDPYCSRSSSEKQNYMGFTNAIGYQGKFFALSLQGTLAVIEAGVDSSDLRITALGPKRVVPCVHSRYFREYLVESNGEILLVFLISRKSANNVDDVEVFKLDMVKLSWVKMERIGDRTLFLWTNCCMSVSASKMGCKSDSVYFSNKSVEGWWEYDIQESRISPCPIDKILPPICRALDRTSRRRYKFLENRLPLRVFS